MQGWLTGGGCRRGWTFLSLHTDGKTTLLQQHTYSLIPWPYAKLCRFAYCKRQKLGVEAWDKARHTCIIVKLLHSRTHMLQVDHMISHFVDTYFEHKN